MESRFYFWFCILMWVCFLLWLWFWLQSKDYYWCNQKLIRMLFLVCILMEGKSWATFLVFLKSKFWAKSMFSPNILTPDVCFILMRGKGESKCWIWTHFLIQSVFKSTSQIPPFLFPRSKVGVIWHFLLSLLISFWWDQLRKFWLAFPPIHLQSKTVFLDFSFDDIRKVG